MRAPPLAPPRGRARLPALLLLVGLPSCRATGDYLADRALDALDPYRFVVGAGTVAGVRARGGGLWSTGLLIGAKPKATALGWRYGAPLTLNAREKRLDANQAQVVLTTDVVGLDIADGSYDSAWNSFALLPALFTWADATSLDWTWEVPEEGTDFERNGWLWSPENFANNRYAQIHAFDVELEIGLLAYVDLGFSPGEALDFWLGWIGIDIAQDDDRL